MHDAVLEVNHWCHEKVIYTPSDARTSSPLASIKTAYGRCGEESTFTVAALRSVGIPARQVYTPRWAHTDDNHAWVEAWVDGKWYFFGACEPEPVLNLGWFNAPASRGMLMHTKVFGKYNGTEEVMMQTPLYTEINIIDNYAETAKVTVTVKDKEGKVVSDARVEFKVYNYAEFYTVANKKSDEKGQTFLTAGKGDMLVWASKDGCFGFSKVSFGKDKEVTLVLDKEECAGLQIEMDIVPPVEAANLPEVTPEQRAENTRRMAEEDSNVFVPQQFINPANPQVHRSHTGQEILEQVDGPIHGFCSGIGTGGTITGIGETLKAANPDMEIWAVEPEHAAILSGGSIGSHLQMGIGDGVIPDILNQDIYQDIYIVKDEEAIRTAQELASKEGIMCGISSGTNVAAAIQLAKKLGEGKTVVTVLPDTAERYFSTPLFEE